MQLTELDQRIYEQELADFLPATIVDAHTHIWQPGVLRKSAQDNRACTSWPLMVAPFCTIEQLLESYRQMFPGKK